jgi:glycosyltransferase involved in cell wall biosynthesis
VDSSDKSHPYLKNIDKVRCIPSSHKNQPYQRLLGASASTAEIVVFFDDDLTILNHFIFKTLINAFEQPNIVGATVGIDYQSSIQENFDAPLVNNKNNFSKFLFKLSGIPNPAPGKASRLGIVGGKPKNNQKIDFFYGPCMCFRKNILDQIIVDDLLSLYENKVGKGEDKVISMLATQFGDLMYIADTYLSHPPNASNYYQDQRNFTKKVAYSRLYLTKIYSHVHKKEIWKEVLMFYYFILWRVFIAILSLIFKPSYSRMQKLLGLVDGTLLTLKLSQKSEKLTPHINWKEELKKDLYHAACA